MSSCEHLTGHSTSGRLFAKLLKSSCWPGMMLCWLLARQEWRLMKLATSIEVTTPVLKMEEWESQQSSKAEGPISFELIQIEDARWVLAKLIWSEDVINGKEAWRHLTCDIYNNYFINYQIESRTCTVAIDPIYQLKSHLPNIVQNIQQIVSASPLIKRFFMTYEELRITKNYKLRRTTNYELRITNYKLQITNYELLRMTNSIWHPHLCY